MEHFTLLLAIVIATALVFDFTNGFHDTANAMATTISTGALKPKTAVAMSAVLNLVGAFLSVEVAKTISGGLINESGIRTEVIFAALVGAIIWNLFTWLLGLPSSSSHALFGGLIGATLMSVGASGVNGGVVITKVLIPALAAPVVAGLAAMLATRLTYRISARTDEKATAKGFRAGQIASAGLVSLAHGTNDAQKTMGVITLALVTGGVLSPGSNPPLWVIVSAGTAIALGTYLGGWRIIKTMGTGLTDLRPQQGFAAQTSAATVILASSHLGFSLSTTQSCSGAVMGAGLGRKGGVVRWSTATRMFVAWGLTLPAAGLVAAGAEYLTGHGTWGVTVVAILLVAASAAIWLASRRRPVDHTNVTGADVVPVNVPVDAGSVDAVAVGTVGVDTGSPSLAATIPGPAALPTPPAVAGESARTATV
ncbi:inorganic phosphate transporter [Streptomyces liangshanensis]|uniref:Phosphate transporter n=1 Tax=Streptomyces liangshanensis TaxID=2717324 RepID=A0A6G9H4E1_9ACTN|nr:inorganic phosphate transporter [Streptomyces liangshanensis]QIQ05403.1 inorganic phosphate transporter [Streptomyces liangshanensis]